MKKMIILATITMVVLTGCGSKEETAKETEHVFVEEIEVEEIEVEKIEVEEIIVSDEYLQELEYNSKENVYFGEES